MEEHERISVMASAAVIVLTIAAFVAFIFTGGGALFYLIAVLALLAGVYTSYRISREAKLANRATKSTKSRKPKR